MFFKLLFIFFNITHLYCYNLNLEKFNSKHVHLNLEKFNSKYNLLHVAVTFSDPICSVNRKICRFDFRKERFNRKNWFFIINIVTEKFCYKH